MRLAVVVLAWTALLLPWERCHSLCHDHVRPALSGHACHGSTCADDEGAHQSGESGGNEARHETVEFVSLRPDAKVAFDAVALLQAAVRTTAPVRPAAPPTSVPDHDPAPDLLCTTVMLL